MNSNSLVDWQLCVAKDSHIQQLILMDRLSHFTPWSDTQFKQCLKKPHYAWVLEHEGVVAGFAIAKLIVDESELLNLVIDTPYQGKKMGRKLLNSVCERMHTLGARCMFLEVRCSNSVAIGLYQSAGFSRIAKRKGYYASASGREDALILRKDL